MADLGDALGAVGRRGVCQFSCAVASMPPPPHQQLRRYI